MLTKISSSIWQLNKVICESKMWLMLSRWACYAICLSAHYFTKHLRTNLAEGGRWFESWWKNMCKRMGFIFTRYIFHDSSSADKEQSMKSNKGFYNKKNNHIVPLTQQLNNKTNQQDKTLARKNAAGKEGRHVSKRTRVNITKLIGYLWV